MKHEIALVFVILAFTVPVMGFAQLPQGPTQFMCPPFEITRSSTILRPDGGVNVVGFIENKALDETYENVKLVGIFYGPQEKLIDVETTSLEFPRIGPLDFSPFKIVSDAQNSTLDFYDITCYRSKVITP